MKFSRDKGKRGEREACAFLRELGFIDAERTAQRRGDTGMPDVICPHTLPFIHIEVKFSERIDVGTAALEDAFAQAQDDCAEDSVPVVLWRRKHGTWRLTFALPNPLSIATIHRPADIAHTLRHLQNRDWLRHPPIEVPAQEVPF